MKVFNIEYYILPVTVNMETLKTIKWIMDTAAQLSNY